MIYLADPLFTLLNVSGQRSSTAEQRGAQCGFPPLFTASGKFAVLLNLGSK